MKFTKEQVFQTCRIVAPIYHFEPELIQALCLKESGKDSSGNFQADRARLEQGFYLRYVEGGNLATTTEILLSASYGVTQMMGQSLMEVGYFGDYLILHSQNKAVDSQMNIVKGLDDYCEHLINQITYSCKWLQRKQKMANGDIKKMLSYWNGDITGKYANEVLQKYKELKK